MGWREIALAPNLIGFNQDSYLARSSHLQTPCEGGCENNLAPSFLFAPWVQDMATSEEIQAQIAANLAKPKRVKTSTAEVEQHSLADQLAIQRDAANREAASANPFFGMRVRKAKHTRDGI